jgi:hypothetical protein
MKRFVLFLSLTVMMLSLSVAGSNTSPPVLQSGQQLDQAPYVMMDAPVVRRCRNNGIVAAADGEGW